MKIVKGLILMKIEVYHVLSSSYTNSGKAMSSLQGYLSDVKVVKPTYALACPLANPLHIPGTRPYRGNDAKVDCFGYYWQ